MGSSARPEQDPDIAAYMRSLPATRATPQGVPPTGPAPQAPVQPDQNIDPDIAAYMQRPDTQPQGQPAAQPEGQPAPAPTLTELSQQDHPQMTDVVTAERAASQYAIQQLQQVLQKPNISPEQRTRVERLIDNFSQHWYNPVSSNRGTAVRLARGAVHGAVSYGVLGLTDLVAALGELVSPEALQDALHIPQLRDNIAEAQEILRTNLSEGKAGAIGAIAGTFGPELGAGAVGGVASGVTNALRGEEAAAGVAKSLSNLRGPWSAANELALEGMSKLPGVGEKVTAIMEAARAPKATYAQRALAQIVGSAGVDAVQALDVATDERLTPEQRLIETAKQLGISLGAGLLSEAPGVRRFLGTPETPKTEDTTAPKEQPQPASTGPTKSPEDIARESVANAEADVAEAAYQDNLRKWRQRRNQQAAQGFNQENPGVKWRDLPESAKQDWRDHWFKNHPEDEPVRPDAAIRPSNRPVPGEEPVSNTAGNTSEPPVEQPPAQPLKASPMADRWARAYTGNPEAKFTELPLRDRQLINSIRQRSQESIRKLIDETDAYDRARAFGFTPGDEGLIRKKEIPTEDLVVRMYEYGQMRQQLEAHALGKAPAPTWLTDHFQNAFSDIVRGIESTRGSQLSDDHLSYLAARLKLDGILGDGGFKINDNRAKAYAQNLVDYFDDVAEKSAQSYTGDKGGVAEPIVDESTDPIVKASQEATSNTRPPDIGRETESTASGNARQIELPDMGIKIDAATWSDEKIKVYLDKIGRKPEYARDSEVLKNVLKTREITRASQNPTTAPTETRWSDEPTPADALPTKDEPTNPPANGGRIENPTATANNLTNPDGVNIGDMSPDELQRYAQRLHKERNDAVRERFTDAATGFGNLDALKFIRRQIDKRADLSWIAIDVKHVKAINDLFQYGAGSKYIKDVAKIIDDVLREKNATGLSRFFSSIFGGEGPRASRSKGDEFWLVAPTGREKEILDEIVSRVNEYVKNTEYGRLMAEQHGYELGVRGAYGSKMADANNNLKNVKRTETGPKYRKIESKPSKSTMSIDDRITEVEKAMDKADTQFEPDSPEWRREMDRLMPLLGKLNDLKRRGITEVRLDDTPIAPEATTHEDITPESKLEPLSETSHVYEKQLEELNARRENGEVTEAEFADEQAKIIARRDLALGKTEQVKPETVRGPLNEDILPSQLKSTDAKVEAERVAKLMRTPVSKLNDDDLLERTKIISDKLDKARSEGDKSAVKEFSDQLSALNNEQARRGGMGGSILGNEKGFIRVDIPRPEIVQMVIGAGIGAALSPEGERTENAFYGAIAAYGAGRALRMWRQAQIDNRPEWRKNAAKKVKRLQDTEDMKPKLGWRSLQMLPYQHLVNGTAPIGEVERLAGMKNLPAALSPRKLAEMFNRWRGISETWLFGQGPDDAHWSLQRIANSVQNDIEGLGYLSAALRELDLRRVSQNKKTLGLEPDEAMQIVNQFKDKPEYFVAAKQLTDLLNHLADHAVAQGMLDPRVRGSWTDENYVHIVRVFSEGLPKTPSELNPSSRSRDNVTTGQPFKSIKGSHNPILNPVEGALLFIPKVLRAIEFNTLAQRFFDVVDKIDPAVRKAIATPLERPNADVPEGVRQQAEELSKLYDAHGTKVSPEDAINMIHALTDHRVNVTDDIITFWRNGQKVSWRVAPDMANAFRSLNGRELEMFMDRAGLLGKVATLPAMFARVMITGNPIFIARQAIRDAWQFGINGAYDKSVLGGLIGKPILQAAEGSIFAFHKIMQNHPDWQEYLSAGSNAENVVSESLRMLRGKLEDVERLGKPVNESRYHAIVNDITTLSPRAWLRAYVNFASGVADAGRFAAYLADRGRGADVLDALYTAKIKGGNFGQRGSNLMLQALNKMTLFLNPSIQGLESTRRAFKEDPFGYVARAVGGIAIPTAMLYFAQEDDQEIRELRTSQSGSKYWFIRLPGEGIVKFPKPIFEGQILGTGMEAMLDYAKENDPYTYEAWRGAVWNDVKLNLMPLVGIVPYSIWANQDLNQGGNIVPEGDSDTLDPAYQTRYDTSLMSKWAGEHIAPYVRGNTLSPFTSPAAIDYTIKNLGGSSAWEVYRTANQLVQWERTGRQPLWWETSFVRDVFAKYPSMNTGSIEKFYTMAERTQRAFGTWKYLTEQLRTEDAQKYYDENENLIALAEVYAKERKRLLDMRKAITDIQEAPPELQMDAATQRELIEAQMNAMIERARTLNDAAQSIMHITNSRTQ